MEASLFRIDREVLAEALAAIVVFPLLYPVRALGFSASAVRRFVGHSPAEGYSTLR